MILFTSYKLQGSNEIVPNPCPQDKEADKK